MVVLAFFARTFRRIYPQIANTPILQYLGHLGAVNKQYLGIERVLEGIAVSLKNGNFRSALFG